MSIKSKYLNGSHFSLPIRVPRIKKRTEIAFKQKKIAFSWKVQTKIKNFINKKRNKKFNICFRHSIYRTILHNYWNFH